MLDQDTRLNLRENDDIFYAHIESDDSKRKLVIEKHNGMVNEFVHLDEQGRPTTYFPFDVERIEVERCKLSVILRSQEQIYIGHTNITPNHYCIEWCANVNAHLEKEACLMESGQGILPDNLLSGNRFVVLDSYGRMRLLMFTGGRVRPVHGDIDWDEITPEMVGKGKTPIMRDVNAMHEAFVKKERRKMAPIKSRKGRR